MDSTTFQRQQAALGLEQLAALVRAQAWRKDGSPSLPPTQGAVLRMLAGASDGLRAAQITERLGISAASLSDTLKTMEARRWIRRASDPGDRRAAIVTLTAAGSRTAARLQSPTQGIGMLLDALGEPDVGALLRITQLLVLEAQQQGLATGLRTCIGCRYFRPFASPDAEKPHLCAFVGQPFGDAELRVDCPEQDPADPTTLAQSAQRFRQPLPR